MSVCTSINQQSIPTPGTSKPASPTLLTKTSKKNSLLGRLSPTRLEKMQNSLPFKTSTATITFKGSIWDKLNAIYKSGFNGVEIMMPDLDEASPEEIFKFCNERGMKITILQPFRDLEGYEDEEQFQSRLCELEKTFDIMRKLKTDLLLCCSNCLDSSSSNENLIIDQLTRAADLASAHGIRLAYENLSWSSYTNTFDKLCRIVEKVNRDNFGFCIDSFHINIHKSSLLPASNVLSKIFFVQLCDAPELNSLQIIEIARNYRVFPIQGDYTNLEEQVELLLKANYKGHLSLEVFNKSFREKDGICEDISDDALRSLIYIQAVVCDKKYGTNFFPDLKILGVKSPEEVLILSNFKDLSLCCNEDSATILKSNAKSLGYEEFLSSQIVSAVNETETLCKRIILNIDDRLTYNRYTLLLKTLFKMRKLKDDGYNVVNEFNLPLQTSFGYNDNEGLVITLKLLNYRE